MPVTHPPREIDGVLVPGYMSPEDPDTYPEDLLSSFGLDYRVYAEHESSDVSEKVLLDEWLGLTSLRRDLVVSLMDQVCWDFLFVEFQKTDNSIHKFRDKSNIKAIYKGVDRCIGDILDVVWDRNIDPNVFVVSDHGIGQKKDWSVALNTWFSRNGYVETKKGKDR